jgi:hypothetical protein
MEASLLDDVAWQEMESSSEITDEISFINIFYQVPS